MGTIMYEAFCDKFDEDFRRKAAGSGQQKREAGMRSHAEKYRSQLDGYARDDGDAPRRVAYAHTT
eukprot:5048987-Lingulodinium_polyedra.AAC.1